MKLIEIGKYRVDIFKGGNYSEFKYRFHYLSGLNDWSYDNVYCDYRTHFFDFKLFKIGFSRFLREVKLFNPQEYYIRFHPGDKVWVYREISNKIIQVTIDNILIDKGGWCYEYSYNNHQEYPCFNGKTYSGGKEVFATKEELIDYYGLSEQ